MIRSLFSNSKVIRPCNSLTTNFISKSKMSTDILSTRLKGKVAVVTASTDGIGFAIAKRLGAEGASVVISSRKENNVNKAVKQLKDAGYNVTGTVCHVANAADRQRLFKTAKDSFGGIDILVSNAAVNPAVGPTLDCPEDVWDKIFDVNIKSAFMLSKEVLPYLQKRKGGSIIYISSIGGFHPIKVLGAYSVSKTALLGLTKAVAMDVADDNIRVNCLAPGIIETKFSGALHETKEAKETVLSMVPMRRLGTPDEMGAVVAFLCSDDASYITGETFIAAGGMASRL